MSVNCSVCFFVVVFFVCFFCFVFFLFCFFFCFFFFLFVCCCFFDVVFFFALDKSSVIPVNQWTTNKCHSSCMQKINLHDCIFVRCFSIYVLCGYLCVTKKHPDKRLSLQLQL